MLCVIIDAPNDLLCKSVPKQPMNSLTLSSRCQTAVPWPFMSIQLPRMEVGGLELTREVVPVRIEHAHCAPSSAIIKGTRVSMVLPGGILEAST
jgi:hypothetical protein